MIVNDLVAGIDNVNITNHSDNHNSSNDATTGPTITRTNNTTNHTNSHSNSSPSRSCLLYTSPSPRDRTRSRMPSSA